LKEIVSQRSVVFKHAENPQQPAIDVIGLHEKQKKRGMADVIITIIRDLAARLFTDEIRKCVPQIRTWISELARIEPHIDCRHQFVSEYRWTKPANEQSSAVGPKRRALVP